MKFNRYRTKSGTSERLLEDEEELSYVCRRLDAPPTSTDMCLRRESLVYMHKSLEVLLLQS